MSNDAMPSDETRPSAAAKWFAEQVEAASGRTCDHIVNYSGAPCAECVAILADAFAAKAREDIRSRLPEQFRDWADVADAVGSVSQRYIAVEKAREGERERVAVFVESELRGGEVGDDDLDMIAHDIRDLAAAKEAR